VGLHAQRRPDVRRRARRLDDAARSTRCSRRTADDSPLFRDEAYRTLWAENLRLVMANVDGYVFDNLAWDARGTSNPREVTAPTLLRYGEKDDDCPPAHAAMVRRPDRNAELVIAPGDTHLDVIDGHWPEVLAGLIRIWR